MPEKMECTQCGFISSNKICKACVLLEGLNTGKARVAIGRKEEGASGKEKIKISNEESKEKTGIKKEKVEEVKVGTPATVAAE